MVKIFLDDGHPESVEYESNYLYFDERNPQSIQSALRSLERTGRGDVAVWLRGHYQEQLNPTTRERSNPFQRFAWRMGAQLGFNTPKPTAQHDHANSAH